MTVSGSKTHIQVLCGCLFALCFWYLTVPACSAQELAWRLTTGDRFEVTLGQQKQAQTSVDKRIAKNHSQTSIRQSWEVEAVDDKGNFRIQQTIKSIRISVENPELPSQALIVDTDSKAAVGKESTKVLNQIRPLIDLELIVTISPRGEILGVSYSDQAQKILQELPGSLDLQSLFTADGIKDLLGAAAIVFPEKSPNRGERWQVTDTVRNPLGEFQRTRAYHLARVEGSDQQQVAVIELKTTIEPKSTNEKNGKLNSFTEIGELRVDLSRGFVRSSRTESITDAETYYRETGVKTTIENINTLTLEAR